MSCRAVRKIAATTTAARAMVAARAIAMIDPMETRAVPMANLMIRMIDATTTTSESGDIKGARFSRRRVRRVVASCVDSDEGTK